MYLNKCPIGFLLIIFSVATCDDFTYYKNLWSENLQVARQWTAPTSSERFKNIPQDACQPFDAAAFDFVIVGGGTAGCVLADRLSANPRWRVLLVEAGGNETAFSLIPGAYLTATRSEMNWGYATEPQDNACGAMPEARCAMPRARVLGGETALKDVTYVRGNLRDFDAWGDWWAYNALKYFKRMENATALDPARRDEKYRGTHGRFHIEYPQNPGPLTQEIYAAFRELGWHVLGDYNGESQMGIGNMQAYTVNGQRGSTNQRYLQPVISRPNLKVLTHALASRIRFEKVSSRKFQATQLEFLHENACYTVNVSKELLLTAGPINTPQLLMLSGIGPEDELRRNNITRVKHLDAVGANLEDHLSYRNFVFRVNRTFAYGTFDEELRAYLQNGAGSLAEPLARLAAFVDLRSQRATIPAYEIMFVLANPQLYYPPADFNTPPTLDTVGMQIMLLHPRSRGSVRLRSADPTDYPRIDPAYLQSRADRRAMVRILKAVAQLAETGSFRAMNATVEDGTPAVCLQQGGANEDARLECAIRYGTVPMHHQIGTCRMGDDRRRSCVDRELLVRGVRNLRVVDASAIPRSTSGHTVPLVIMMAEAMADHIITMH